MARALVVSALLVAVAVAALLPAGECGVRHLWHKTEYKVAKGVHNVEHAVKKTEYKAAAAAGFAAGVVHGTVSTAGHLAKQGLEHAVYKARNKLADKISTGKNYY